MTFPGSSPKIHLRSAMQKDAESIRALIYQVGINPMSLNWRHFIVAVDDGDHLAGCGQIKQHRDGSYEMASIAVRLEWRQQGIASMIIHRLQEQAFTTSAMPLYLTCRAQLGPFYERFGFRPVGYVEMPPYFRRISRLVSFLRRLLLARTKLLVMVYSG